MTIPTQRGALARITRATQLMAEVKSLEDTLKVRDYVTVIAACARVKGAKEVQAEALEIQLRAERKAGEFLGRMEKNPGAREPGTSRGTTVVPRQPPKLSDLRISKNESSRWQQLARLPEPRFEELVDTTVRKRTRDPADHGEIERRYSTEPHPPPTQRKKLPVGEIRSTNDGVIIRRVVAPPNHWTFKIPAVADLLATYVGDGRGWADPFCGRSQLAEYSNDLDKSFTHAQYHMEAVEFVEKLVPDGIVGTLFDPPYSKRQISEHYRDAGQKATMLDTSGQFYSRVRRPLAEKIRPGGLTISFGWNSTGFGPVNGFRLVEVLLVNHGDNGHNDTIVTVERKSERAP